MDYSQVIDITVRMDEDLILYPGDQPPAVRRVSAIAEGAALTCSELVLGCHLGTHVDAPAHFIESGRTVEQLELRHFYGKAIVAEFPACDRITEEMAAGVRVPPGCHVLIKTRNSELLRRKGFEPNYCTLAPEAAERLLESRPLSIGFDYYSLDPVSAQDFPSHREVARRGLPVFVCLDLRDVPPGEYTFFALPIRLPEAEALPVRAVLFRD